MTTAIAAKTAAETFKFKVRSGIPVTIHSTGLAGAETIALTIRSGTVDEPVRDDSGTPVTLNATNTQLTVVGVGSYRLTKGITAGLVAVYIEE